jgi:hypothetical protein
VKAPHLGQQLDDAGIALGAAETLLIDLFERNNSPRRASGRRLGSRPLFQDLGL